MSGAKKATFTVRLEVGTPFETGETCPVCLFDSMVALLVIINGRPRFHELCGRSCCREA